MAEGEINGWASHIPSLMTAVSVTAGPVIECGVGFNSTPLLHAVCAATGRALYSLDGNSEWLATFKDFASPEHSLVHVPDWSSPPFTQARYGVAFVDHDSIPRGALLPFLRGLADIIVMHDSETEYCGYMKPLEAFDWVYTHENSHVWTTLAGLGSPPPWLAGLLPGRAGIPVAYRR